MEGRGREGERERESNGEGEEREREGGGRGRRDTLVSNASIDGISNSLTSAISFCHTRFFEMISSVLSSNQNQD